MPVANNVIPVNGHKGSHVSDETLTMLAIELDGKVDTDA